MPNPLSRVRKKIKFLTISSSGFFPFDKRQDLAILNARILTEWSTLEQFMRNLLHVVTGPSAKAATPIFNQLTSSRQQHIAIEAACMPFLDQSKQDILLSIMKLVTSCRKQRNTITHSVYAFSSDLPDAILLIDQDYYSKHQYERNSLEIEKMRLASEIIRDPGMKNKTFPPPPELDFDKIYVYTPQDLMRIADEIREANRAVGEFIAALNQEAIHGVDSRQSLILFSRLCNLPRIRESLSHIRGRRKSASLDRSKSAWQATFHPSRF